MSRIFGNVCQNGYVVRDIEGAMKSVLVSELIPIRETWFVQI